MSTRIKQRVIKACQLAALAAILSEGLVALPFFRTAEAADPNAYAMVMNNHLKLSVSMVWEGSHMHTHNIEAIKEFRRLYTDIAIIHFVSPAYFLNANGDNALDQLRSTLQKQDHIALLLGGWKSIATGAGVSFRSAPTFFGNEIRPENCSIDCGLEVPLTIYSPAELNQIVRFSADILAEKGLGRPIAAMVSGWNGSPALANAMAQNSILYDFSAVSPELVKSRLGNFPIYDWISQQWNHITPYTQPYLINTKPQAITEIPQNLAAIDYLTSTDVQLILENYAASLRRDPTSQLVFSLTMYQETAAKTLPKLTQILQNTFAYAEKNGLNLRHLDLPDTGVKDKYAIEPLRYTPPGRFVH